MFMHSAQFYDAIYAWKDYAAEARRLKALLAERQRIPGRRSLLDVACGTAAHAAYLRDDHAYEGLDLDPTMLALAQIRFPDLTFHQGDMLDFDLGRQFELAQVPALSPGPDQVATRGRGLELIQRGRHTGERSPLVAPQPLPRR